MSTMLAVRLVTGPAIDAAQLEAETRDYVRPEGKVPKPSHERTFPYPPEWNL